MRSEIRRNRQPGASINRRTMTTGATSLRSSRTGIVLRVVKLHVEWFVEAGGKIFQGWIVAAHVRVADSAHRYLWRCELAAVTISAGFVTGKRGVAELSVRS